MYQSKTILISVLLSLIIGLSLGFYFGKQSVSNGGGGQNAGNTLLPGENQSFTPPVPPVLPADIEIRSVSGTIKEIKGNILTVESYSFIESGKTVSYAVTATAATKIVLQKQKDMQEFQKEMDAFQKTMQFSTQKPGQSPATIATPPMLFAEVAIALKDLKIGNRITAEANENVRNKTSFDAIKIMVMEETLPMPIP